MNAAAFRLQSALMNFDVFPKCPGGICPWGMCPGDFYIAGGVLSCHPLGLVFMLYTLHHLHIP